MKVSTQHKRSLQDWNAAFEAHVAMPIRLQSTMKKTSGDSNRRLQTVEVECFEQDNGLLECVAEDFPGEGVTTVLIDCPTNITSVAECQSCSIIYTAADSLTECSSCSICSDTENNNVAYDCSNLFEGDCVIADCDECLDDPPPYPPDTPTPPTPPPDECVDSPEGWHDSLGIGCDLYDDALCDAIGLEYENDGYTAKEACCVCGGGNNGTVPPCEDVPGWSDSLGLTCEVYAMAPELCQIFGPEYANNGLTASEACCACGTSPTPPPNGVGK
jgi:hypothetical protein